MQRRTIWLLSVIVLAVVITMAIMRIAVENLTFQADEDPAPGTVVLSPALINVNKDGTYNVVNIRVQNLPSSPYPCPGNYTPEPIAIPVFYQAWYADRIMRDGDSRPVNWHISYKSIRTFSGVIGYDKTYERSTSSDGTIYAHLVGLVEKVLPDPVHHYYLSDLNVPYDFLFAESEVVDKPLVARNSVALPTPNNEFPICKLNSGTQAATD